MLKNCSFGLLTLASIFLICVNCLDEDLVEIIDQSEDSSQFSNEVLRDGQFRLRRDNSELRAPEPYISPNSRFSQPESIPSHWISRPKYWTYQRILPKSEVVLTHKQKRYMGVDLTDFMTKNQEGNAGGPSGAKKQKLSSHG